MVLRIVLVLLFFTLSADAKHLFPEKYYQEIWCSKNNGQLEAKLIDNTRIDCLTQTQAVEFDFASKWAEAIGQSLYYGRMTGKTPAIVLIIEKESDFKYYTKIKPLCEDYKINLSYITPLDKPAKPNKLYYLVQFIEFIMKVFKELMKLLSYF
ncbi:MAG: hypothetical protein IJB79_03115 [Candidatus Gastranaerophilales bacterium]|nr:hypothetical protein [Candidatus Gastranaerophilales bacterium]